MAGAFGHREEAVAKALRYFIPPVVKAIEKKAHTADGLISVLEFLGSRRFDRFLDDPRMFGHIHVFAEGRRVLEFLFGHQDRLQRLVDNRAKALALEPGRIMELLPYVAIMVVGAVEVRTKRPLTLLVSRLANGGAAVANPYLALAQHLNKLEREQREQRRRRFSIYFGLGAATRKAAEPVLISASTARVSPPRLAPTL